MRLKSKVHILRPTEMFPVNIHGTNLNEYFVKSQFWRGINVIDNMEGAVDCATCSYSVHMLHIKYSAQQ